MKTLLAALLVLGAVQPANADEPLFTARYFRVDMRSGQVIGPAIWGDKYESLSECEATLAENSPRLMAEEDPAEVALIPSCVPFRVPA
jgi:hypothetical protein